jgi:lysyl-tRNA synthetase class II
MRQPYIHQCVIPPGFETFSDKDLVEHPQMMSPLAKYHRSKKGMF